MTSYFGKVDICFKSFSYILHLAQLQKALYCSGSFRGKTNFCVTSLFSSKGCHFFFLFQLSNINISQQGEYDFLNNSFWSQTLHYWLQLLFTNQKMFFSVQFNKHLLIILYTTNQIKLKTNKESYVLCCLKYSSTKRDI